MLIPRHILQGTFWLIVICLMASSASASGTYPVNVTRDGQDFYETTSGWLIQTRSCGQIVYSDSSTLSIGPVSGVTIGELDFSNGSKCTVLGVYGSRNLAAGNYQATLTGLNDGFFSDTAQGMLVRGSNNAASLCANVYFNSATLQDTSGGPSDQSGQAIGSIAFSGGNLPATCPMFGIFYWQYLGGVAPPLDTTPPGVPPGFMAYPIGSMSIGVSWNASTDDVGVAAYKFYINGKLQSAYNYGNYTSSAISPSAAGNYAISVSACDAAGNCSAQTTAANIVLPAPAFTKDIRTYVPAAATGSGYVSMLRVINKGSLATPISVAKIDSASGVVGTQTPLAFALPANAAITYTAQQVENLMGLVSPLDASDRPRLRVTAYEPIEVQAFVLQSNGLMNEVSAAQAGATVTVSTYIPVAGAAAGYQSYLRIINTGALATPVSIAHVDPTTGLASSPATLISSLPPGAALTYDATRIESALGISPTATERPTLIVSGNGQPLEIQAFLSQPGGAFSNVSSTQSGSSIDLRNYVPAATSGYTSYLRVINNTATETQVTVALIDPVNGFASPPPQAVLIGSLPGSASVTLTSAQVETALGIPLSADLRPRLRIASSRGGGLTVQSFMLQPGGAFNEFSGAQSGAAIYVRTFVPAADAATGYTSYLRVINTGAGTTPVSAALVDGVTGSVGNAAVLIASLAPGAVRNFTSSQVEAALGAPIAAGTRPRILITGDGTQVLEVQSFLAEPGGVFTEVSGAQ